MWRLKGYCRSAKKDNDIIDMIQDIFHLVKAGTERDIRLRKHGKLRQMQRSKRLQKGHRLGICSIFRSGVN